MELQQIRRALMDGLLSFPVTDFDSTGSFDPEGYMARLKWFMSKDISAVFVAGGTGEFFSLTEDECRRIVELAVPVAGGRMPVISSVGRSVSEAVTFARIASDAGIDALLLMPPYLTECPAEGAVAYARAIMENTDLPVIYYNRSNGVLGARHVEQLAAACPNLIGLKDGTGNIQELNDIIRTMGDRLVYIGGVPTAEIISQAYLAIGVNTYSSAVFNFVPDLAVHFYRALQVGNQEVVNLILKEFFIPFVRLRGKKAGYAVSLIKAGARIAGRSAGDVRPPLVMPDDLETEILTGLIRQAAHLI
ncbi:MAG: 5-dehydro-4-deoxyglucarate dehydratase [Bacteroidia bacterium]